MYAIYDKKTKNVSRFITGDITIQEIPDSSTYVEVKEAIMPDFGKYTYRVLRGKVVTTEKPPSREEQVRNIVVTTQSGKAFDGDEKSQDRMSRVITGMQAGGVTSMQWKLHDNRVVDVTVEELGEALALAGKEMSRIWLA